MNKKDLNFSNSITLKFMLTYFIATSFIILSLSLLIFENQINLISENSLLRSLELGNEIKELSQELSHNINNNSTALIEALMTKKYLNINYIHIFNSKGETMNSTKPNDITLNSSAKFKSIQLALTKNEFQNSGYHHDLDLEKRIIDLFIPVSISKNKQVVINTGLYFEEIDKRMEKLYRQSGILTIIVIAINILFALSTYNSIINPLKDVTYLINELSAGNYNLKIATHRNDEFGFITKKIKQMSTAIGFIHEQAKNANPLTGLPGNIALENNILKSIKTGNSFCVLYCDLDNFKAYNDAYGFSMGDEVILYTRDVLVKSITTSKSRNSFLGHEGGDDFVIVCDFYDWEKISSLVVKEFDKGIDRFYNEKDKKQKKIISKDRLGNIKEFPFIGISIAVVTNHYRKIVSFGQIVQYAAEMKKVVKSIEGSSYRIDRRAD